MQVLGSEMPPSSTDFRKILTTIEELRQWRGISKSFRVKFGYTRLLCQMGPRGVMKQAVLATLLLAGIYLHAETEAQAAIGNVAERTTISLDGSWNTIIDPYESGMGSRFYENAKPKTKSDLVEYDFEHSPKLHVPGDWNTQRESLLFYEGPLWYQRNFLYHKRTGVRTILYFAGAN